ncbi:addiction module toxin, HicA family [Thiohalocapsa halophila]|uniref:Addiction module toxin, HicA family n=1 Tax=Thiohalocapsa halophila TaxID=69359 RepID=A0ABS1CQX2_9GAMM|nr:addiction module toxin, HicA family [Thiohalocapsa halophila]
MGTEEGVRFCLLPYTLVATRGGHRQFKHPDKPGRVTVFGRPSDEVAPSTKNSIFKQAGWR